MNKNIKQKRIIVGTIGVIGVSSIILLARKVGKKNGK